MTAAKKVPSLQVQIHEHLDEYGWCRANQHVWRHQTGMTVNKGIVTVLYRCEGCSGERVDDVSLKSGEVINRSYRHPQGYLMKVPAGQKRPSKTEWRREHFRNITKERKA